MKRVYKTRLEICLKYIFKIRKLFMLLKSIAIKINSDIKYNLTLNNECGYLRIYAILVIIRYIRTCHYLIKPMYSLISTFKAHYRQSNG